MLKAYVDESGHEGKEWVFLAGYLGNEDQWKEFVPKWKLVLGRGRKFLHMNRLRWTSPRTKELLERLAPIPEGCGLEGVMGGVRVSHYHDLVTGTPDEKITKGYISCLMPMVTQILRGIPADERIEITFEEQRQYRRGVDLVMRFATLPDAAYKFTRDGKPKLAKWGFVPKGSTLMTDPADYLAYALRHHYIDKTSKRAQWTHPILTCGSGEAYGVIYNREQIRRVVKRAQMVNLFQGLYS